MELAGGHGGIGGEQDDSHFREVELSHLFSLTLVGLAISFEGGIVSADLGGAADEGQLRGFPIPHGHVGFEVAAIPGFHLGIEDGFYGRNFLRVRSGSFALLRKRNQGEG